MNFTSASSPTMNGKMPHIQCTAEEIGEIVLLPGDPGRVAMFEDLLEDYKIVSNYREYVVGTGYYNGIKVTVCSTGIGGPSTEIAVAPADRSRRESSDPHRRDRRAERRCTVRGDGLEHGCCPERRCFLLLRSV
ncbi:MAG: hypothetical protein ACLUAR_08980 [Pilosibacter sp.]